jgi:hypothetical protein
MWLLGTSQGRHGRFGAHANFEGHGEVCQTSSDPPLSMDSVHVGPEIDDYGDQFQDCLNGLT